MKFEEFKEWMEPQFAEGSGSAPSYARAIEMVYQYLGIQGEATEQNLQQLESFYDKIKYKNSDDYKSFLDKFESHSYLEKNFVTAALAKYFEYLDHCDRKMSDDKDLVSKIESTIVKKVAYSRIIAVTIDHFAFEVAFVMLQLALDVRQLSVKFVLFCCLCSVQVSVFVGHCDSGCEPQPLPLLQQRGRETARCRLLTYSGSGKPSILISTNSSRPSA